MCWGLTVLFLVVVALLARVTLGSGLTARDEGERRLWVADDGTGARAGAGGRVGVAVAYAHARRAPSERKGRYWGVGYYGLFSGGAGEEVMVDGTVGMGGRVLMFGECDSKNEGCVDVA